MSDALAEIKALYYGATKQTIHEAFDRAIDLLKTLPSDDDRERATAYMQGLAEMRKEWWGDSAGSEGRSAKSRVRSAKSGVPSSEFGVPAGAVRSAKSAGGHRHASSAARRRGRKLGPGSK
jgi:hypothetical protein